MGEYDKLLGRREALEDLNSSASGRPERAGQLICEFDGNATLDDRGSQRRGLAPGIARGLGWRRERFAIGLRDILSRDSASWTAATASHLHLAIEIGRNDTRAH